MVVRRRGHRRDRVAARWAGVLPTAVLSLWVGLLALFGILPAQPAFIAGAAAAVLAALWVQTGRVLRSRQRLPVTSFAALGAAFAHDFLMWDLEEGRCPRAARCSSSAARRWKQPGGSSWTCWKHWGVSWFNDFIHPSAVGHLRIAELLCATTTAHAGG
ncbi:MAG: hypothetical protein ACRD3J_11390 [Thermoanaerobaculia bacterium]